MRFLFAAVSIALLPASAIAQTAPAPIPTPAATPAGGYRVEVTDIGTLLDDPAAKAILDKHMPGFSANPQIDMARAMTLKSVQQYAPDKVTDKALADIQIDLSKLPAKK